MNIKTKTYEEAEIFAAFVSTGWKRFADRAADASPGTLFQSPAGAPAVAVLGRGNEGPVGPVGA